MKTKIVAIIIGALCGGAVFGIIKGVSTRKTRNDMTNSLSKRAKEQLKLREDKIK